MCAAALLGHVGFQVTWISGTMVQSHTSECHIDFAERAQ